MYKSISLYPDYFISKSGIVCKIRKGELFFPAVNISTSGYKRISLFKNKKQYSIEIHVLVAMAYLNHKPCGLKLVVDHIDTNKLNNNLNNLRIITNAENCCNRKTRKGSVVMQGEKYTSRITIRNERLWLGTYDNKKEALKAIDNFLNK